MDRGDHRKGQSLMIKYRLFPSGMRGEYNMSPVSTGYGHYMI